MKKPVEVTAIESATTQITSAISTTTVTSFDSRRYPIAGSSFQSSSKTIPYQTEDGKIAAGKYIYDQDNFWKGRIPGVRQTYPFPRARPIIFHNEVVGMPVQFGPYEKYSKGPPSPPPPTPVRKDAFPKQPECCCFRIKRKSKKKDNLGIAFGIKTTDPNADLSLDKAGFDCCKIMKFHVSPQFRYKKFQRRFVFKVMWMIVIYYIPPLLTLLIILFVEKVHQYLMYKSDIKICAVTLSVTFSAYIVVAWFSGLARYRPWPILVLVFRLVLSTICTWATTIGTEHICLEYALDDDPLESEDEELKFQRHLDTPHSYGYWPILGFVYGGIFRLTVAFLTRYTKCHFSDFAMKVILYLFVWSLFCLQECLIYRGYTLGIFYGPRVVDVVQTSLGLFSAALVTVNTLRNFHRLFSGKKCAMTEKEYLYCLLRLAN